LHVHEVVRHRTPVHVSLVVEQRGGEDLGGH
jgi:hypothetical protein